MKTLIFDIESDGFLDVATQVFVLIAQDVSTDQIYTFTDHDDRFPSLADGLAFLKSADALAGHNILEFDLQILKKLFDWEFDGKVFDTWIISEICSYNRRHRHGLAGWGEHLGYAKLDFDQFDQYSDEMRVYCQRDVELNTMIYRHLMQEVKARKELTDKFPFGLRIEHDVAEFNAKVSNQGWLFDMPAATALLQQLTQEMETIEAKIEPMLGDITKLIDKEPKTPKYKNNGEYNAATCRILGEYLGREVRATEALLDDPPMAPGTEFQRSVTEPATLGNMESVKQFLLDNGWKPDEYNMKNFNGQWIRQSPKLTTTSLEKLGDIGTSIDRYYTLRSRQTVLQGWMDRASVDGRLRGKMWLRGTPTFRVRHEVIANLPSVKAEYGPEMRSLLIAEDGRKIVGADSSGNQFRALCHYVKDDELTKQVLEGDIHSFNASILGCSRDVAKTWIYAFLFGAGDGKLGKILTGVNNLQRGRESRSKFASSIPGLGALVNKAKSSVNNRGYLPGLDGRKVFTPKDYQALNYLLQAAEAVTCKAAISYAMNKIKEEGLDAEPRLFYHDEQAWSVAEGDAERVKEILEESFRDGPKLFGVEVMDGEGCIGENYAEVH